MDVAGRLERLRSGFDSSSFDALLVTDIVNVRYLTGFSGSEAMLFVGPGPTVFLTDGRYKDQCAVELAAASVDADVVFGKAAEQLTAIDHAAKGIRRLGIEADNVTLTAKERFESAFSGVASGATELVALRGVVEALRVVKDAGELARIELAADIADVALAQVKHRLTEGVTERQFAMELDYEMRNRGADDVSFATIVASGPNGAFPHHSPSDRLIERGDVVVVDFGAEVDGYRSDITRTLCWGSIASSQLLDMADAVLVAQRAGVRTLRPGATGAEVDAACRESLERAGYGELYSHGTGHGVGLVIHEAPAISAGSADILQEGSVVTVEPGAYLKGLGGVRFEDTLVITATGARALTKSTKDAIL